jgi:hypothetical protein
VDDILTDAEIARLISMPKVLPLDYESRIVPKARTGHRGAELEVVGEDKKTRFVVVVRVATANPLDFTAILAVHRESTGDRFHLRRYNGKAHRHANNLEKEPVFYDFHIHHATERYQLAGKKEETYAVITDRYGDIDGAVQCLLMDCGFVIPPAAEHLFSKVV